ncbi:MAG TPA: S1C family serine protease [Flavobacterium sp.]|nr:S1C family serine protease [Flavobacterium sp.]
MKFNWQKIKHRTLVILGIFVLGGFGGLVVEKYVAPFLGSQPIIGRLGFLHPESPIVYTKTEQIRVNESVNLRNVIKQLTPNVVAIVGSKTNIGSSFLPSVRGTGLVLTSDGIIATDNSLLADKKNNYWVVTSNGDIKPLQVLGVDPKSNLALVKVDLGDLSPVNFGSSTQLEAGQQLVTLSESDIANSSRFSSTYVTTASGDSSLTDLFSSEQATATYKVDVVPTAGAGIFNLTGQLVGVGLGSGRIIPAEALKAALDIYLDKKVITRPFLGISYHSFAAGGAKLLNVNLSSGIILASGPQQPAVVASSPAKAVGLVEGDIVAKFNDQDITPTQSFNLFMNRVKPGEVIKLSVWRGGKLVDLQVTLGEVK